MNVQLLSQVPSLTIRLGRAQTFIIGIHDQLIGPPRWLANQSRTGSVYQDDRSAVNPFLHRLVVVAVFLIGKHNMLAAPELRLNDLASMSIRVNG